MAAAKTTKAPGVALFEMVPEELPLLVLPTLRCLAFIPLLDASAEASMETVLTVFVMAVVAKVSYFCLLSGSTFGSSPFRKTNAKPGAGTFTAHVLSLLHDTVLISTEP
jgi:hypothetical protein